MDLFKQYQLDPDFKIVLKKFLEKYEADQIKFKNMTKLKQQQNIEMEAQIWKEKTYDLPFC